jgi:4-hydroxy-tetrahydrodipicolinate synthase
MKSGGSIWKGIITATPTPLRQDGAVDAAAVRKLAENLVTEGADGLCPVGGTGEYVSLTQRQRRQMVDVCLSSRECSAQVLATAWKPRVNSSRRAPRLCWW